VRRYIVLTPIVFLISLLTLNLYAQDSPYDIEPNDYQDQAVVIDGFVIEGHVGGQDDPADWYRLKGQQGDFPTVELIYNSSEYDIDIRLYSDDSMAGSLASRTSPDKNFFEIPGTCYLEVVAYEGGGDYRIVINDGGDPETLTAEFQANCGGPSETEPNDTRYVANDIEELTINGFICDGDTDWFVLYGQEGNSPDITLEYNQAVCDIDAVIYTDSSISNALASEKSPDTGTFAVPGNCYIRVFSWNGIGEYTLLIKPAPNSSKQDGASTSSGDPCQGMSEFEPNNEKDLADTISGFEINGYACEGDGDWYVLDGQEGTGPWIDLTYELPSDIDLEIFDDDEWVGDLKSSDTPDTGQFVIDGKCYIHVWAHYGEGPYSILITPENAPPDPSRTTT